MCVCICIQNEEKVVTMVYYPVIPGILWCTEFVMQAQEIPDLFFFRAGNTESAFYKFTSFLMKIKSTKEEYNDFDLLTEIKLTKEN